MDATAVATGMRTAFGDRVEVVARSGKRIWVRLAAQDLPEVAGWLLASLPGCRLATTTGIDLRDGVGLFHHFVINGSPLVVTLKVLLARPDPHAPTLATRSAAAEWIEREISDLLGVTFDGHPDARRLLKDESMAGELPLRRDFDVARFKEGIGERPEF
jgi:NADH:ubiquinone oxidoreductase subunit C